MAIKKRHYSKIKEGIKDIFKTEVEKESENLRYNGLTTSIGDPLVKHQIIQLAKLCEEVPLNVTLKTSGNRISIEFW